MNVFAEFMRGSLESHRHTVHHAPGVWVVAVQAAPLTAGGPGDQPHARAIDGRAGGERMQEAYVSCFEGFLDCRFRHGAALVYAELKRTSPLQRSSCQRLFGAHVLYPPWQVAWAPRP